MNQKISQEGILYKRVECENILLQFIRESLKGDISKEFPNEEFSFTYNPKISQIYITLFESGQKSLRWGAKKLTLEDTILWIIKRLKEQPRINLFHIENPYKCRIMFEIVTESSPCNIRNLTGMHFINNRFEPGVTGLKIIYNNQTRFFMPTDAVTYSIMSIKQLLNFIYKRFKFTDYTKSISKRIHLMRRLPIQYTSIKSKAFISFEESTIPLYRGLPILSSFSKSSVYSTMSNAFKWLLKNQNDDGSFLYYYDPIQDSNVDFLHPKSVSPLYNNILRHSGGTISLLKGYSILKDKVYLEAAKKSIDFFISTFRFHHYQGEYACYPFFNKKSKLGGAGIGLVSLMHYYQLSGDNRYMKETTGLVRHILSRIEDDGEMIGYYIHPSFNDGNPIIKPNEQMKKDLFSFYYPGEALLGLALYFKYTDGNNTLKEELILKSKLALDFLVDKRPIKYHYMFDTLPADAWLMQAIEEWIKVKGFSKKSYIDFVFNDTQKMFDHMYQAYNTTSSNKDYIGGFFYNYGDHVYHDASRNEGIVAAYYIAKYLNNEEKASYILTHMLKSAKSLILTYHSPESSYAHLYPEKSIGSFRFKLTRQWVRVDSVQHAVCFFSRLYETGFEQRDIDISEKSIGYIDGYSILNKMASSGFSNVYLVENKNRNKKNLVMKLIKNENNLTSSTEIEATILEKINDEKNIIKYYGKKHFSNGVYFLFEHINSINLGQKVKKYGVLNEDEATYFMQSMIEVLEMTYSKQILHLDIKPTNILYDKKIFYLIDWGLAREGRCFLTHYLKGNPIYIAPEAYIGVRCMESEIYALGCTLYELLTGKKIFNLRKRDSLIYKMYAHLYQSISLHNITSKKFKYILEKMLIKNPQKRITLGALKGMLNTDNRLFDSVPKGEKSSLDIKNIDEAKMLKKMAAGNIAYAEYLMALKLMKEKGTKDDVLLLLKKAAHSLPVAHLELGIYYYECERYEDAYYIFKSSYKHLSERAMYYFACLYYYGKYIKQDYAMALRLFNQSVENNYRPAAQKILELKVILNGE